MSVSDDKNEILTKISALTSLKDNIDSDKKNFKFSVKSISNKNNAISFLLDTMKSIIGSDALKEITGELIGGFIDKTEPFVKNIVKKQLIQYNSDDLLPESFLVNGINIDVNKIDVGGKLRINPDSDLGKITYKKNVVSFNKSMYNAIKTEQNVNYSGLTLKYNSTTDKINIKSTSSKTIGEFFNSYVDNTTIINRDEIVTEALDLLFGTVTIGKNKSESEINNSLKTDKILNNLINGNDGELSNNELSEIEKKSKELYNGYLNNDFCCGDIIVKIPEEYLVNLVGNLGNDPFIIGNKISEIPIDNSIDLSLNENQNTVKDNFLEKFINSLILGLTKAITISPEIKLLVDISSQLQGKDFNKNSSDFIKNNIIFIKCISNQMVEEITDFIFKKIIVYLNKLLEPVIKKMLKEKIKQFRGIIKTLIA